MEADLLDKLPPYSSEAEMAVLGSMLIEKEALERGLELLDEKSFYDETRRKIFAAIRTLALNNKAVDVVTLSEELRRQDLLASIGGAETITQLTNSVATAAHIEHYADIVHQKAMLRELIRTATQVVGDCYKQDEEAEAILDRAEASIYTIADKKDKSGLVPVINLVPSMIQNLEDLFHKKQLVTGIATGFKKFDELTAGLHPGNLVIFAARPGGGKTALALSIAMHAAVEKKKPVAFFSLEMSEQEIGMRLLSAMTSVPLQKLRTGWFEKTQWTEITRKAELLSESPLYLDSRSGLSILTLRASIRRLATQLKAKNTPLGLIIIDYLQLMQGSRRNPESRQTEVAEISRSLKGLARDLNVPIVALSQLNRSPEEKGRDQGRPQLANLRESGALEQDADLVAAIYRESMYKKQEELDEEAKRKALLMILKQRNGPLGEVELVFLGEYALFGNPDFKT